MKSKFDPQFAAGFWPCVVLDGGIGEELDNNGKPTGRMRVRVNIKFTDGPDKGKIASYEDEINAKSALYVSRSLKAIGCKTPDRFSTVKGDIERWIKETGGATTAEVRHIETKRGKRYDEWVDAGCPGDVLLWAKVNSLGRGPRPLAAPSGEAMSDAEEQMRRAMAEDGGGTQPEDDVPHAGDSDDIPFATVSRCSLGEIAKVLR